MLRAWLAVLVLQTVLVLTAAVPQHREAGPASAQVAWVERGEHPVSSVNERIAAQAVAVPWVAPRAALPWLRTRAPSPLPVAPSAPREPLYLRLQRFLI